MTETAVVATHEDILQRVIRWGIVVIIFSLPLWFSRLFDLVHWSLPFLYTNIVFSLPKEYFFTTLIDILSLLWIVRILLFRGKMMLSVPPKKLLIVLTGLVLSLCLSTLLSDVPVLSFFGQYEKGQGLFMMIHYVLFVVITLSTLRKEDINNIFKTTALSAFLVALYGIIQAVNLDPITIWQSDVLLGRVFSTLGHPNYLAYYFLFTLPVTGWLFWTNIQTRSFVWTGINGISFILQGVAFYLTGSRAAWGGLVLGIVFLGMFFMMLYRNNKLVRKIVIGGLAFLVCVTVLFFAVPKLSSVVRLDTGNMRSVESRLFIWNDTLAMIAQRPLFGYGPDTYLLYFPQVKSQELLDTENYNQNADRAHNSILDTLQSTGVVGLLFYLMLYGLLLFYGIKFFTRGEQKGPALVFLLMFLSFFLANMWGFPIIVHDVYFWCMVSLLIILLTDKKEITAPLSLRYGVIFTVPFILAAMVFSIRAYVADHLFYEGIVETDSALVLESINYNPFALPYLTVAASMSSIDPTQLLDQASALTNGKDLSTQLLMAHWLMKTGKTEDGNLRYRQLSRTYPHIPRVYVMWGEDEKEEENYTSCVSIYQQLLSISPVYWQYDGQIDALSHETRERYRLFFKENPTFRSAFDSLAYCSAKSGDTATMTLSLPHMSESPLKYILSFVQAKLEGKTEESKKYFEKCVDIADNTICESLRNQFLTSSP